MFKSSQFQFIEAVASHELSEAFDYLRIETDLQAQRLWAAAAAGDQLLIVLLI